MNPKMIKVAILDDEQLAVDSLKWLLQEYCPDVHISAMFTNGHEALDFLSKNEIDLIFLDIDMPELNGFEFLERWERPPFKIVFTTAYNEFAIKAFKVSAFEYLLKPIDEEELISTINKFKETIETSTHSQQFDLLLQTLKNPENTYSKIAIPTSEGIHILNTDDIIRMEADSNYTTIHLVDKQTLVASKTLKEIESNLNSTKFLRIHQSHTICIDKVKLYHRGSGGSVRLSNGDLIPVSKAKKEILLSKIL